MGKYLKEFSKGIVKENPVFRLCLGTCPTLAISTTLSGSIGMGLAATLVLICSNTVISLLRKVIPDKIRIPAYITVIAGFVKCLFRPLCPPLTPPSEYIFLLSSSTA